MKRKELHERCIVFSVLIAGARVYRLLVRQVISIKKDISKISIVLGVKVNIIIGNVTMTKKWQNLKNFIEWT